MRNLLRSARRRRSRTTFRYCIGVIQLTIAWTALFPVALTAQRPVQPELRLGLGTFLSHDRGWNYGEPIEFFAALTRRTGSVDLEAAASFSKSFAHFSMPAVDPPPPSAYRDGFRARLGLRVPSVTHSIVSALVGAELVHNHTEGATRTSTLAGTAGVGLNFGSERRGTVDLRYVRFAKRLGSSRAILPLTLAWRL
jgi:hypothetical protein